MVAYVFSSQAAAQACAAAVDAHLGFPKTGSDVGGGTHVVPTFITQTYQTVIPHPTLSLWAYPADGNTNPVLMPNAVTLGLPASQTLDSTWTPASAMGA